MSLNVAVQMDPIERINIGGDSTFALLLEAQRRRHTLSYYTPDQLVMLDGKVSATVAAVGARQSRRAFHARRRAFRGADLVRRRAVAPGPALRPRLHHLHAYARTHPAADARRQRPGAGAQRTGKGVRHRISRS